METGSTLCSDGLQQGSTTTAAENTRGNPSEMLMMPLAQSKAVHSILCDEKVFVWKFGSKAKSLGLQRVQQRAARSSQLHTQHTASNENAVF